MERRNGLWFVGMFFLLVRISSGQSCFEREENWWGFGVGDSCQLEADCVQVGRSVSYQFVSGAHNVYSFSDQAAFDSCDFTTAQVICGEEEGNTCTETFNTIGLFFRADQFPDHCAAGVKLLINVSDNCPSPSPPFFPSSIQVDPGVIRLKRITIEVQPDDPDNTTLITYTVVSKNNGWTAIAFANKKNMVGSDSIVWSMTNNIVQVTDRFAVAHAIPNYDEHQNFFLHLLELADGVTTIIFSRYVETGDVEEDVPISEANFMLWAMGSGPIEGDVPPYSFQKHSRNGILKWNKIDEGSGIFDVEAEYTKSERNHGILMFISWTYGAPLIALSTSLKFLGKGWLLLHLIFVIISLALHISAFAIIVDHLIDLDAPHFEAAHQGIGLTIFILSFIQPILGLLTHFTYDKDRESIPLFPNRFHHFVAWVLLLLALANVLLGVNEIGGDDDLWIITGLWVALLFVVYILNFILKRSMEGDKESENKLGAVLFVFVGVVGLVFVGLFIWKIY